MKTARGSGVQMIGAERRGRRRGGRRVVCAWSREGESQDETLKVRDGASLELGLAAASSPIISGRPDGWMGPRPGRQAGEGRQTQWGLGPTMV